MRVPKRGKNHPRPPLVRRPVRRHGNSSMFDQLNCIKVRIDFAIIGNQSEMDFFFDLAPSFGTHNSHCAQTQFFGGPCFFLFLRISRIFCHCAIVHLLIFSGVLILFILTLPRELRDRLALVAVAFHPPTYFRFVNFFFWFRNTLDAPLFLV